MKNILFILAILAGLTACGDGSKSATDTDSSNSTTPPPTSDSTSTVGPMMGDTSKTVEDSVK